jgi:hypothetical protein
MKYSILKCYSAWLTLGCFSLLLASCEDFIAEDVSQETIILNAPDDQTITELSELTFWWEPLSIDTNYRLQIVTPSFDRTTSLILDTLVINNQLIFTLNSGQYAWRVRAENATYRGVFSNAHRFTITEVTADPDLVPVTEDQEGYLPFNVLGIE